MKACIGHDNGARCRNLVRPPADRCAEHQGELETAPKPETILVKFFGLKPEEVAGLEKGGVRKVAYKPQTEDKHRQQAKKLGRDFHAYRKGIGDSGTAVFGKEGARFISITNLISELMDQYCPADCHIKERPEKQAHVLVVTFSREDKDISLSKEVADKVLDLLTASRVWAKVDVWANPPQENGSIVHTVNCHHWGIRPRETINCLVFQGGLWDIEQKS